MIQCCVNRFIQQQSRFILKLFTISSELDDEWNMNHSQAATDCLPAITKLFLENLSSVFSSS